MFHYSSLYTELRDQGMDEWAFTLEKQMQDYVQNIKHGDFYEWRSAIKDLPKISPSSYNFKSDMVRIGEAKDCTEQQQQRLLHSLKQLMPWRKGPFDFFGIQIDSEWRSDLKWQRLQKYLKVSNKIILDIGCGNGYYTLRMLGADAKAVVGIDPTLRFVMQFEAIKYYLNNIKAFVLPIAVQHLPLEQLSFDMVFSMGVIYHRRDPQQHATQLFECLRPGGELIIESLIVDRHLTETLIPEGRYAKMNNVWWIPCIQVLMDILKQAGFKSIDVVDESITTTVEQRCTEWMQFESLTDFLDSDDPSKTIEGYPAPKRAMLYAIKPE